MVRPACRACTEFANDYADIAVGGLDSPDDYAIVLIRTERGNQVYNGALRQGYIEEKKFTDPVELRGERTKMMARVVACARGRGNAAKRSAGRC